MNTRNTTHPQPDAQSVLDLDKHTLDFLLDYESPEVVTLWLNINRMTSGGRYTFTGTMPRLGYSTALTPSQTRVAALRLVARGALTYSNNAWALQPIEGE